MTLFNNCTVKHKDNEYFDLELEDGRVISAVITSKTKAFINGKTCFRPCSRFEIGDKLNAKVDEREVGGQKIYFASRFIAKSVDNQDGKYRRSPEAKDKKESRSSQGNRGANDGRRSRDEQSRTYSNRGPERRGQKDRSPHRLNRDTYSPIDVRVYFPDAKIGPKDIWNYFTKFGELLEIRPLKRNVVFLTFRTAEVVNNIVGKCHWVQGVTLSVTRATNRNPRNERRLPEDNFQSRKSSQRMRNDKASNAHSRLSAGERSEIARCIKRYLPKDDGSNSTPEQAESEIKNDEQKGNIEEAIALSKLDFEKKGVQLVENPGGEDDLCTGNDDVMRTATDEDDYGNPGYGQKTSEQMIKYFDDAEIEEDEQHDIGGDDICSKEDEPQISIENASHKEYGPDDSNNETYHKEYEHDNTIEDTTCKEYEPQEYEHDNTIEDTTSKEYEPHNVNYDTSHKECGPQNLNDDTFHKECEPNNSTEDLSENSPPNFIKDTHEEHKKHNLNENVSYEGYLAQEKDWPQNLVVVTCNKEDGEDASIENEFNKEDGMHKFEIDFEKSNAEGTGGQSSNAIHDTLDIELKSSEIVLGRVKSDPLNDLACIETVLPSDDQSAELVNILKDNDENLLNNVEMQDSVPSKTNNADSDSNKCLQKNEIDVGCHLSPIPTSDYDSSDVLKHVIARHTDERVETSSIKVGYSDVQDRKYIQDLSIICAKSAKEINIGRPLLSQHRLGFQKEVELNFNKNILPPPPPMWPSSKVNERSFKTQKPEKDWNNAPVAGPTSASHKHDNLSDLSVDSRRNEAECQLKDHLLSTDLARSEQISTSFDSMSQTHDGLTQLDIKDVVVDTLKFRVFEDPELSKCDQNQMKKNNQDSIQFHEGATSSDGNENILLDIDFSGQEAVQPAGASAASNKYNNPKNNLFCTSYDDCKHENLLTFSSDEKIDLICKNATEGAETKIRDTGTGNDEIHGNLCKCKDGLSFVSMECAIHTGVHPDLKCDELGDEFYVLPSKVFQVGQDNVTDCSQEGDDEDGGSEEENGEGPNDEDSGGSEEEYGGGPLEDDGEGPDDNDGEGPDDVFQPDDQFGISAVKMIDLRHRSGETGATWKLNERGDGSSAGSDLPQNQNWKNISQTDRTFPVDRIYSHPDQSSNCQKKVGSSLSAETPPGQDSYIRTQSVGGGAGFHKGRLIRSSNQRKARRSSHQESFDSAIELMTINEEVGKFVIEEEKEAKTEDKLKDFQDLKEIASLEEGMSAERVKRSSTHQASQVSLDEFGVTTKEIGANAIFANTRDKAVQTCSLVDQADVDANDNHNEYGGTSVSGGDRKKCMEDILKHVGFTDSKTQQIIAEFSMLATQPGRLN